MPTDQMRTLVMLCVAIGYAQDQIARVTGISEPTLRKHYPEELARGAELATAKVAGNLFTTATQRNDLKAANTAAIFWMKTRAGWRDVSPMRADVELPAGTEIPKAGGPVRVSLVIGERPTE